MGPSGPARQLIIGHKILIANMQKSDMSRFANETELQKSHEKQNNKNK